jgi:membrane fusion protein (multidrug efflux system)
MNNHANERERLMKRVLAATLVAAAVVIVTACGGDGEAATPADTARGAAPGVMLGVRDVATVRDTAIREGVSVSGALAPKVDVVVGAPIAEQLAEMLVDAGVAVRQGQPLARFRVDVLRSAAASARAEVTRARLAVRLATADSGRSEELFSEGAISRRDRDNSFASLEGTLAQLALAESQAAQAEDRLATATLRAPVSGIVSERHAQAGDRVDFGKPVVSIVDTRVLQLAASLPASHLGSLRVGSEVVLNTAAGGTVTGRVSRINPTADPATRQVRFHVDVPNASGSLVGGTYVSGRVIVREVAHAVAVPRRAIRRQEGGLPAVVYVIRDGIVRKVTVATGAEDEESSLVEVTDGVAVGDTVIVGPVDNLGDGTRVSVAGAAQRR